MDEFRLGIESTQMAEGVFWDIVSLSHAYSEKNQTIFLSR